MKLYLVEMNNPDGTERFYKVGVTGFQDVMHRFTSYGDNDAQASGVSKLEKLRLAILGYKYIHPYKIKVLHQESFLLPNDAYFTETEILDVVPPHRPKLIFSGMTECFDATQEQLKAIAEYMTSACEERNAAADSTAPPTKS